MGNSPALKAHALLRTACATLGRTVKTAAMKNPVRKEGKNNSWLTSMPETQFYYLCFSSEGSQYNRCDFEEGFCDMTQSPEMTSGWFRTNQVPGLQHDHTGRNSGEPLKCDV